MKYIQLQMKKQQVKRQLIEHERQPVKDKRQLEEHERQLVEDER